MGSDTVLSVMNSIKKNAKEYSDHLKMIDKVNEDCYKLKTTEVTELSKEVEEFTTLLLESKRREATEYIHHLLDNGMSVEELYKDVFQNTLYFIGEQWQEKNISVAHEHYSTVVIQFIMSTLYDRIFTPAKKDKKLLSFSVSHELHEVGIRMISDMFEISGWDTEYLGSSLPVSEFIRYAIEFNPDLIAISVTMPYHVNELKEAIKEIKKIDELRNTKIMVGGRPFITDDTLYQTVGADGYAVDLKDVVEKAEALIE